MTDGWRSRDPTVKSTKRLESNEDESVKISYSNVSRKCNPENVRLHDAHDNKCKGAVSVTSDLQVDRLRGESKVASKEMQKLASPF